MATTDIEKAIAKNKLNFMIAKEEAAKSIKLAKEQMIFGLTAHILAKLFPKNHENFKHFFNTIKSKLPNDIKHLTEVFDSSRSSEVEKYWGWSDWEIISDGIVRAIDLYSKLDKLYCVIALEILEGKTDGELETLELPISKSLADLAKENPNVDNLITLLNTIEPDKWSFILNQNQISKISSLKTLLIKVKNTQEEKEKECLKTANIDIEKQNEFKKMFFEEFTKLASLRNLAKKVKIYNNLTDQHSGTLTSWGFKQIDFKSSFVEDSHISHVSFMGHGNGYGRSMARSEDEKVFKEILEGIHNKKDIGIQHIIQEVENVITNKRFENPLIIQTLNPRFESEYLEQSEMFFSRFNPNCPKTDFAILNAYEGIIKVAEKNIPIIKLYVRNDELKNKIVVTDFNKLGSWNQYSPIGQKKYEEFKYDIFFFRIADLSQNDELRQNILDENPEWLEQHEDKEGFLRQKVLINIEQKFKFEISNPDAGYCLNCTIQPPDSPQ